MSDSELIQIDSNLGVFCVFWELPNLPFYNQDWLSLRLRTNLGELDFRQGSSSLENLASIAI